MTENITEFLLKHFPERDKLSYEDFTRVDDWESGWTNNPVACYAYDYDRDLAERAFRVISQPWPEIDWFEIRVGSDMVPMFLSKKGFIHVFPSLLNYLYILGNEDRGDMLAGNFVNQLDLMNLMRREKEIYGNRKVFDWKREFYASFSDDVKRIICEILILRREEDALASYWGQFAEVGMVKCKPTMPKSELEMSRDLYLACAAAKDEHSRQSIAGNKEIQLHVESMLDAAGRCEELINISK